MAKVRIGDEPVTPLTIASTNSSSQPTGRITTVSPVGGRRRQSTDVDAPSGTQPPTSAHPMRKPLIGYDRYLLPSDRTSCFSNEIEVGLMLILLSHLRDISVVHSQVRVSPGLQVPFSLPSGLGIGKQLAATYPFQCFFLLCQEGDRDLEESNGFVPLFIKSAVNCQPFNGPSGSSAKLTCFIAISPMFKFGIYSAARFPRFAVARTLRSARGYHQGLLPRLRRMLFFGHASMSCRSAIAFFLHTGEPLDVDIVSIKGFRFSRLFQVDFLKTRFCGNDIWAGWIIFEILLEGFNIFCLLD